MLNYQDTYSRMSDDELLRLASQWTALTEPAQVLLAAELETRKLKSESKVEDQIPSEKSALSGGPPSRTEKVMFWLFISSAPSAFLLPKVWPENMRFGIYEIFVGVSDCFILWLIIWLVLRARRLQRGSRMK